MAIEPCLRLARCQTALSVIVAILTQQTTTDMLAPSNSKPSAGLLRSIIYDEALFKS